MRQFGEFLDPDACVAKNFHCRPGPERLVFFQAEVTSFAGVRVLGPGDARAGMARL